MGNKERRRVDMTSAVKKILKLDWNEDNVVVKLWMALKKKGIYFLRKGRVRAVGREGTGGRGEGGRERDGIGWEIVEL